MGERHRSEDPYNWGMTNAMQDDCENCHFASAGGPDKRTAMEAPSYVPEDQAEEFLRGYRAYCDEHYGEGWQTMKWGWHPALVIGGEKGPTDESKIVNTPEEAAKVFGGDEMVDKTDEGISLDEAIDHAMAKADECEKSGEEECEFEHRKLVRWLTELDALRYRVKQQAKDLDTTHEKLRELHRDVSVSLDEEVHVRVEISQFDKRWRHANSISRDAFAAPLRGGLQGGEGEHKAEVLRDVIERVAYEAAIGFFGETRR